MTTSLLQARNVSVHFGGLRALHNVSCSLGPGEIVGIIGPNGAGKTTFLNAISGLVPCQSGASLFIEGVDVTKMPAYRRSRMGLGRTFQNLEFSPKDTVLDNVLVGAEIRFASNRLWDLLGGWKSAQEERGFVDEALGHLAFFQIYDWRGARVESVPYAVKKRLQICRALMANPKVIMLDEPASGMSAVEKGRLSKALLDFQRKTKIAILIIEHDVGFLTGMCQRLIALNFGAMLTEGSCESVTSDQRVIDAYLGNEEDDSAAA